jgi:mannose-6-phosphate isomerase-like protein (cupin superfamily)
MNIAKQRRDPAEEHHVSFDSNLSMVFHKLATIAPNRTLDVFGATVEFVSWSDEFCVMRGVVPPGAVVPLHRHSDAEDFFILSGTQQVLVRRPTISCGGIRALATMYACRETFCMRTATSPRSRR